MGKQFIRHGTMLGKGPDLSEINYNSEKNNHLPCPQPLSPDKLKALDLKIFNTAKMKPLAMNLRAPHQDIVPIHLIFELYKNGPSYGFRPVSQTSAVFFPEAAGYDPSTVKLPPASGLFVFVILACEPAKIYCCIPAMAQATIAAYNKIKDPEINRARALLVSPNSGHSSISQYKDVFYAGEIVLNCGFLMFWGNASGHYLPPGNYRYSNLHPHIRNMLPENLFMQHDLSSATAGVSYANQVTAHLTPGQLVKLQQALLEARHAFHDDRHLHLQQGMYSQPSLPGNGYLQPLLSDNEYLQPSLPNSEYLHPILPDNGYLQPLLPDSDYLHPSLPPSSLMPVSTRLTPPKSRQLFATPATPLPGSKSNKASLSFFAFGFDHAIIFARLRTTQFTAKKKAEMAFFDSHFIKYFLKYLGEVGIPCCLYSDLSAEYILKLMKTVGMSSLIKQYYNKTFFILELNHFHNDKKERSPNAEKELSSRAENPLARLLSVKRILSATFGSLGGVIFDVFDARRYASGLNDSNIIFCPIDDLQGAVIRKGDRKNSHYAMLDCLTKLNWWFNSVSELGQNTGPLSQYFHISSGDQAHVASRRAKLSYTLALHPKNQPFAAFHQDLIRKVYSTLK